MQGTALNTTQLNATANISGTFSYSPALGTVMNTTGAITLSTTFTPSNTAAYSTATASVSLMVIPSAGTAVVDFGTPEQTIRGFGASEAWFGVLPNAQITALYGIASNQVGLSIMRLHIAPTTWTSSTQTAATSAWTAELTNGKAAQALGATVFASPWSPPASMKSNNSTNEGSLSASSYADFANYLQAYSNYAANQGVSLYVISVAEMSRIGIRVFKTGWTAVRTVQVAMSRACGRGRRWMRGWRVMVRCSPVKRIPSN